MLRSLLPALLVLSASACSFAPKAADPAWPTAIARTTDPETGTVYGVEQVFIRSGEHDIAATLLLPDGDRPNGAMVLVSGSRDGLASPEGALPRKLVTRGIAVLVLGKKGVGASSGNWERETFADRAANAQAAVDWLARRREIDPARIGLYGHSQGGYIAGIMAARGHGLRFAVLAAAPAQRVREQIASDDMYIRMRDEGRSREQAQAETKRMMWALDAGLSLCPLVRVHYLCGIYGHDPIPDLERIRIPVLVLFGERDNMVPPEENLAPMQAALTRAGVPHVIKVLPAANHQFWKSIRGTPSEYGELVAGRRPNFPFFQPGNARHEVALGLRGNRAEFADAYFDTVLGFIDAQQAAPVQP
jgi:dipeptidyl aminopeptidase/acylaminoacyl peptidase